MSAPPRSAAEVIFRSSMRLGATWKHLSRDLRHLGAASEKRHLLEPFAVLLALFAAESQPAVFMSTADAADRASDDVQDMFALLSVLAERGGSSKTVDSFDTKCIGVPAAVAASARTASPKPLDPLQKTDPWASAAASSASRSSRASSVARPLSAFGVREVPSAPDPWARWTPSRSSSPESEGCPSGLAGSLGVTVAATHVPMPSPTPAVDDSDAVDGDDDDDDSDGDDDDDALSPAPSSVPTRAAKSSPKHLPTPAPTPALAPVRSPAPSPLPTPFDLLAVSAQIDRLMVEVSNPGWIYNDVARQRVGQLEPIGGLGHPSAF